MPKKMKKELKPKPKTKTKSKTKPETKTKQKAVKKLEKKPKKSKTKESKAKTKLKTQPKAKPKIKAKTEKEGMPKQPKQKKIQPKPKTEERSKKMPVVEDEKTRKERLRKVLVQKREDIVREAKSEIKKFKSGEKKQLVETVMDDGDLSVVDLSEDISLKQLSNHRETLIKIDVALRKLEDGTYGICEECGDEISEERLKIMPFAIYCRDCQERRELMEKIEREEA
ncbi:MAG: TraR/DksA family transcriptional regulator [Nitrospiraceae bacterium]|jgi:DnaK suppressor protein|nr:TraR/DksA family transcriptional regulator [Nitrospirota bacterium]MDA8338069.1 TraR/DksA family transcriptional regulator [Nitrospiraceae bacterium]